MYILSIADVRKKEGEFMNVNMLKGKMIERDVSIDQLALKMGIHKSSLYRKLNPNGDQMTIKEANVCVTELSLTSTEAVAIFFDSKVA